MISPETDYIDHCVGVVKSIDPEELAQRYLGEVIGRSSSTSTYALGEIATNSGPIHAAFKTRYYDNRLAGELTDISIILQSAPELFAKFPFFMGRIVIEDGVQLLGYITEDASKGGKNKPSRAEISQETLDKLAAAFNGLGLFNFDELKESTTFDVGGEERLLDMFPTVLEPQYDNHHWELYTSVLERAMEAEDEATIMIPEDSPLARSVRT